MLLFDICLANARVIQTVFLIDALYFGCSKRPWLSAAFLAISVFDPRAFVLALPLIIWHNKQRIRHFLLEVAAFLAITNLPFFLQRYRILFRADTLKRNIASLMYEYDWICL